jgi:Domain of unknown function (DUF4276)
VTPLHVVVEGQSEFEFIKRVLVAHLSALGVSATPIIAMTKRERDGRKQKGGGDWTKWRENILLLCDDRRSDLRITTMFDLFGLPKNFPSLETALRVRDTSERTILLEQAMAREIADPRFLPYLQRHEFEALVLASLPALERVLVNHRDRVGLRKLQAHLGSLAPEDVNDGLETAPSKRLQRFVPSYDPRKRNKAVFGPQAIAETGLAALRAQCPRFDAWVAKLEGLAEPSAAIPNASSSAAPAAAS